MAEPTPEPRRIEVTDKQRLEIEWADGAVTTMTAPEVRAFCQCAGCRELDPQLRTVAAHAHATIESASLVGGYAVNFVFGPDGHGTGIYPFAELRRYRSP